MANNDVLKSKQLIEDFSKIWDEHSKFIDKANGSLEAFVNNAKVPSNYVNALKQVNDNNKNLAESYGKLNTAQNKISVSQKKMEQERLKELKLASKREKSFDRMDAKMKREAKQTERNRQAEIKLASAYNQLNAKLNQAEKEYKDLAASQGLSSKATIKQQKEVQKLRGQIDAINTPIKRFNNNVGNYSSALSGAGKSLRGFIGAFGLIGGVYLFAAAVKDTFNRIREFDKAMQNIAGIMRVSRSEIKDLEVEIKSVAGSSIKTSREVAELAENLVTLGKTKTEIKQLLKPVNNLAIGLETTSGEAAEFLVQTLNAFGAGAEEAEEYADVIATIRTSTSLDFQKMRDSFQYLTPISKILNKDLAYTGSVLGILADNGLKAESAGRLLGTAQQKLASKGRTLQYALDKINSAKERGIKETELLKIASDLFGKQAAKVGIILATNTGVIEKNAQAIRDNGGALDDLVNTQLESMDAKLKILDSTWEQFVLSISSGNGVISKTFSNFISFVSGAIKGLTALNTTLQETQIKNNNSGQSKGSELGRGLIKELESGGDLDKQTILKEIGQESDRAYVKILDLKDELAEVKKRLNDPINTRTSRGRQLKSNLEKQLESIPYAIGLAEGRLKAYEDYLEKHNKKVVNIEAEGDEETTKTKRDKIKEIKTVAIETKTSIEILKEQIKLLTEQRDKNEKSSLSYRVLNEQIEFYNKVLDESVVKIGDVTEGMKEKEKSFKDAENVLKSLRQETQNYLDTFSDGFLADAGLGSLETFMDGSFERLLAGADSLQDKFAVTFNAISEVGQEAFNLISQASQQNFEAEFTRLDKQKEFSLRNAGDSVSAKEEIEKQYEKRRKQIATRQAEAEKKNAIFNIAINTAQAVVSALPNIPLSIGIGVIGAAQLALVASKQIPQFWEGGVYDGNTNGQIMVNDDPYGKKGSNYKEVIEKPNGQILKPQGKNVKMRVPKGTIIHPTYDAFEKSLNDLMVNTGIAPFNNLGRGSSNLVNNNGINKSELIEVMNVHASKVIKSMSNDDGYELNFDEKGFSKFLKNGSVKKEILNARVRGKGRSV